MSTKELRSEERVPVTRRGKLNSGDAWFPCLIVDMSEHGISIMSNRALPVGQVMEFRCELFPDQLLDCRIEVLHVNDTVLGTKIIEIDKKGIDLCHLFLQEAYAVKPYKSK